MFQRVKHALLPLLVLFIAIPAFATENYEVDATLQQFQRAPETEPFFATAYGYAVFPSIGKGGFFVGGAHGSGQVFKDNVLQGESKMTQVSIGLQFGGQAYSQIVFFQDKRAYDRFTSGSFEFDAQSSATALTEHASARAGTQGRSAQANENVNHAGYTNGMAIFTVAKGGLMLEASIAGQKYSYTPIIPETI
ncbi:YSC84-related protein [Thaumasiovibrio subtropicus]|uniref:lipid-binding SYLF domain-containing protein n=1 Tax=Thaumasiovibrio subtropicus TaxID=1891207 RepID=UPI000B355580|nr:lipid-binding SYLF domain-containing protein [Thaumasiovibrio subtropicus]